MAVDPKSYFQPGWINWKPRVKEMWTAVWAVRLSARLVKQLVDALARNHIAYTELWMATVSAISHAV